MVAMELGDESLRGLSPDAGPGAFEAWIQPLYEIAIKLAFAMVGDRGEAEDAVQEAALRAWRARGQVRLGADARPWFLVIVANRCRTRRRGSWRRVLPLTDGGHGSTWPAALGEGRDLHRAIRALDPTSRLVVVLRYYLDLPYEEVAAVAGLSTTAARARVSRALRRLRAELDVSEVPV
jgi:RNA polymerase sigma-70 factor, ECF subfamily